VGLPATADDPLSFAVTGDFGTDGGGFVYTARNDLGLTDNAAVTLRDAILGNPTTAGQLALDAEQSGVVDFVGDQDWYAVRLDADTTYQFYLEGSGPAPLSDPFLTLNDSAGRALAQNDDRGPELDSRLFFRTIDEGTYFLGAQGFDTARGTYTLSAAEDVIILAVEGDMRSASAAVDDREDLTMSPLAAEDLFDDDGGGGTVIAPSDGLGTGPSGADLSALVVAAPDDATAVG
jgi:hypothetical protein